MIRTAIIKEIRIILVPWLIVMSACLFSVFARGTVFDGEVAALLALGAIIIGVPLLASFPLGYEFQNRTFSLLLSQPKDRMEVWWTKWTVGAVAATLVALPKILSNFQFVIRFKEITGSHALGATLFLISICAGTYWTLLARSTIGGVVLNIRDVATIKNHR